MVITIKTTTTIKTETLLLEVSSPPLPLPKNARGSSYDRFSKTATILKIKELLEALSSLLFTYLYTLWLNDFVKGLIKSYYFQNYVNSSTDRPQLWTLIVFVSLSADQPANAEWGFFHP